MKFIHPASQLEVFPFKPLLTTLFETVAIHSKELALPPQTQPRMVLLDQLFPHGSIPSSLHFF
jgi:hypothetical protein